ncbi:hypothetical protein [Anaerorhabdus furcosa]|uniref:Uncharacterized protein n=1 Tax=Anaerorhabdus furcosa TaxID=118967 RepID=A0A1T4KN37_9FIRM|nr:hypothetical protein [Anaerorhabdus furcosa]SJZ43783.1 hypothetical protein SAMN02745191_0617 [Anaerorhabdus furcosa]
MNKFSKILLCISIPCLLYSSLLIYTFYFIDTTYIEIWGLFKALLIVMTLIFVIYLVIKNKVYGHQKLILISLSILHLAMYFSFLKNVFDALLIYVFPIQCIMIFLAATFMIKGKVEKVSIFEEILSSEMLSYVIIISYVFLLQSNGVRNLLIVVLEQPVNVRQCLNLNWYTEDVFGLNYNNDARCSIREIEAYIDGEEVNLNSVNYLSPDKNITFVFGEHFRDSIRFDFKFDFSPISLKLEKKEIRDTFNEY